jgi:hypothetical protein
VAERALAALAFALLGCAPAAVDGAAPAEASESQRGACERALASLAPDPAQPISFALPPEATPALRALRGTGRGARVAAFEAALERSARLALADAAPCSDDEVSEAELRARVAASAPQRLDETRAPEMLAELRDAASRLPLPRSLELDLVSLVTDRAVAIFEHEGTDLFLHFPAGRVGGPFSSTTLPSGSRTYIEGPVPSAP